MKVLYEDNHIIVVEKEPNIPSQSDKTGDIDMLTLVKNYIKEKYNKPGNVYLGLVHRLDINTSGIMVFARTSKAAARLNDQIKNHVFVKKYIATVEGILTNKDFIELKSYLLKNESEKKSYVNKNGQEAILSYRAIKNYKINNFDVTDILVNLKTGRFHQIRCQMANISHPLYGDKKYGSKNDIDVLSFPLDCYKIMFPHPTLKEMMEFEKEDVDAN
jgi:23S rRNA pseudouridine1911/1915/1917 synthase